MNDRCVSLLENYDIEVLRTMKGRGAILCETDQGMLIFKEYMERRSRIAIQDRILTYIREQGIGSERIIRNKEDELLTVDGDGTSYVLKSWFQGKECDLKDMQNCYDAVAMLARLHGTDVLPELFGDGGSRENTLSEFARHTRELKKIRRFLKSRGQKSDFEILLMQNYSYFLEQALQIEEEIQGYTVAPSENRICHGDFQYHNILVNGQEISLINFEKCGIEDATRDLGLFLRKILEKTAWQEKTAFELIDRYHSVRSLSEDERRRLYARLSYPEKFWKIANFYYNSGKAWIPAKNTEKLYRLLEQEEEKKSFLARYRELYLT